jgi:hypothetical protein
MKTEPPEECANCGSPIPRRAKACPSCGADERTGWRETSVYDGLDLPDEDDTPSPRTTRASNGVSWFWIAVGVGLLVLLILGAVGLR